MNKITINKALMFKDISQQWLNQGTNQQATDVAECIQKVKPEIDRVLAPYYENLQERNEAMTKIKIEYASKVELEEITQEGAPIKWKFEYADPAKLIERNKILKAMMNESRTKDMELQKTEVEIEPVYAKVRPARQLISKEVEELFTGIVISTIELIK